MAKVIIQPTNICKPKIFDGTMVFKDVKDMIGKIDDNDLKIKVSKGTLSLNSTHNIHRVHFCKDDIIYEIHLTKKQFDEMKGKFEELGEVEINEYFWLN